MREAFGQHQKVMFLRGLRAVGIASLCLIAACAAERQGCPACTALHHQYPCDAGALDLDADQSIDMLFLSGGGSFGAYGAGVLYGWSSVQGPRARPRFTVVTGVSTGALQATHAFLGTTHDRYLYRNYTTSGSTLLQRRPWWKIPFSSSVDTAKGLERVLEQTVTDDMIDAVAAQRGKRLLCVGSTNLDSGQFVSWDLTRVASEHRYGLYRRLLLASASVPAASPPVEIDGSLHGDGGLRRQIFAVPVIEQVRGSRHAARDRAYFLVNDELSVRAQCTRKRILPLAARAIRILEAAGLDTDLEEADRVIARSSTFPGGVDTYFLYIPGDYPLKLTSSEFHTDEMCRLFCRGRFDGSHANWRRCRPASVQPRACGVESYPVGDTLDASSCPSSGPQCPPDSVYRAFPATCAGTEGGGP